MKSKIVFFLLLLSSALSAQDEFKDEFIKNIGTAHQDIKSITCDFEQIQEVSVLSDIQRSTGKFYYMNSDQMKWELIDPSPYYFLFSGAEVYKFDGSSKTKLPTGSPQVAGFKKIIMGTMDGSIFQDENFVNTFVRSQNEMNVDMVPQKRMLKRRFDKISLTFDYDRMVLLELVFHEVGGDKRSILFFNHKLNTLTDASVFQ